MNRTNKNMEPLLSVSDAKAKKILLALCFDNELLAKQAARLLSQMTKHEEARRHITQAANAKRKADSIIDVCTRCHEPFYGEDNLPKSCRFHNGTSHSHPTGIPSTMLI